MLSNVRVSCKGTDGVVEVVLEGQADQIGDWVLCLLDQRIRVIGGTLWCLLRQDTWQAYKTQCQQTANSFHCRLLLRNCGSLNTGRPTVELPCQAKQQAVDQAAGELRGVEFLFTSPAAKLHLPIDWVSCPR